MKTLMLEYTKTVLDKVSFDTDLFCREVQKASRYLLPNELEEIKAHIQTLILENPDLGRCLVYFS
jgi:hypothetical protein